MTTLQDAYEIFNARIREAEDLFVARFKTKTSLLLNEAEGVSLEFARYGEVWGLWVIHKESRAHILSAGKTHRIEAALSLGLLWQACLDVEADTLAKVLKATSQVEYFLRNRESES